MNANHLHNLAVLARRALPGCAAQELPEAAQAIVWAESEIQRLKQEAQPVAEAAKEVA